MRIIWLGHSCFKIESREAVIVVDPYKDGSVPGLGNVRENADIVLCSHGHDDHSGTECVKLSGDFKADIKITKIDTFHDHHNGTHRGKNTIHMIEADGYRIAHLGDLGCQLQEKQKEQLKDLDLLLVPVGGFYTIDAKEAAELVLELKTKTVIPMHYREERNAYGYDVIGTVSAFTELMDSVTTVEGSEICMENRPDAQVVVLSPANGGRS